MDISDFTQVPQLTREAPIQMTNVLLREKQPSLPSEYTNLIISISVYFLVLLMYL